MLTLNRIIVLILIFTSSYAMANNQELDEQISEAAEYFSGAISGDIDILLPTKLDRERLDYSLESLDAVSAWLSELRATNINSQTEDVAVIATERENVEIEEVTTNKKIAGSKAEISEHDSEHDSEQKNSESESEKFDKKEQSQQTSEIKIE